MANSGQKAEIGGAAGSDRPSLPTWIKLVAGLLVAMAFVAALWLSLSGGSIVGTEHGRNIHDLDVAARGLETWPDSLRTLARSQFIAGNVRPASGMQKDDGWTYRVDVKHPIIGPYQLLYTVRHSEAACTGLRADIERRERMSLPFIASNRSGEGPQLKIIDSIPLKELFRADHADTEPLPAAPIQIAGISADGSQGRAPHAWSPNAFLCYGAVVPIIRLLPLRSSGSAFVDFLIVDGNRHVVRQIGDASVPIDSIDQLVPQDSVLNLAVASAVPGSKSLADRVRPARLADALEPVSLRVARQSFIGYVRPFHLPPGVPGCEGTATATDASYKTPPPTCFLIGLVPRNTLWRSALTVAKLPAMIFGLIFILLLALVPTLQLLLIGSGESVPRITAIFVVAGLFFAAGVATIATTFAADIVREREGARREGAAIVSRMATSIARDITAARTAVDQLEAKNHAKLSGTSANAAVIDPRPFDARLPVRNPDAGDAVIPIGTLQLIGANGRNLACGAQTLRFSDSAGSRINIGGRPYFRRVISDDFDERFLRRGVVRHYTIDQVRSQTDGVNKTILAFTPLSPPDPAMRARGCIPVVTLATTILPTLVAPVLPAPFGFIVVDGRDGATALPVLFHSDDRRAGVETLAAVIDDGGLKALRQWWSARSAADDRPVGEFRARYDGKLRQFAAIGIDGTPWILLVDHSIDEVDGIGAQTAFIALRNWISWCAGMPLLFWLGRWGYLQAHGRSFSLGREMARLWPQQRGGRPYRRYSLMLLGGALPATMLLILFEASGAIIPGLVLATLVCFGTCTALFVAAKPGASSAEALRPDTERDFRAMLGAAAICVAIIPAIALWGDARGFVIARRDVQVLGGLVNPGGAIDQWRAAIAHLSPPIADVAPAHPGERPFPGCSPGTDCLAAITARTEDRGAIVERGVAGLTGTLARWMGAASTITRNCPATPDATPGLRSLCTARSGEEPRFGISAHTVPPLTLSGGGLINTLIVIAIALAMIAGLWFLLGRILRVLAGFGIPLEAITRPNLYVGDRAKAPSLDIATPLPDRALIVGAPFVLRQHFLHQRAAQRPYTQVDLAAAGMLSLRPWDTRIVAFGLQLVLNDVDRRREALERLEACDRHVRAIAGGEMVIMSSLSPLERIIDAYERDRDESSVDLSLPKYREQLRWSLLLERFATFTFKAVDNYNPVRRRGRTALLLDRMNDRLTTHEPDPRARRERARIIETMLLELRWLPAHVVESAIGIDIASSIEALAQRRRRRADIFPLSDVYYQWVIVPLAIDWAMRLQPASRPAAIDYLRGVIIEHYQQCWSASTLAERVILDHLAHDRFVNIERACIPLTSLVRRGLVVFDPTPRLMNRSFRMFVRQAERPERIKAWRALQPAGGWARARLPLLVGLPLAALAMLVAALSAGVDIAVLLPLLLAGVPALISQFSLLLRGQAK